MGWGSASTWGNAWGAPKTELTATQRLAKLEKAQSAAGAGDLAAGLADLSQVGIKIGELISQSKFQKRMLREQKRAAKESKLEARRQSIYRRKDQARASMLQQRLAALQAITGGRNQRAIVAGIGIIVLAGVFMFASRPPKQQPRRPV